MDQEEPIDQQDQPTIGGSSGPITEANTRPQVEATLQADDGMTYTTSTAEVELSFGSASKQKEGGGEEEEDDGTFEAVNPMKSGVLNVANQKADRGVRVEVTNFRNQFRGKSQINLAKGGSPTRGRRASSATPPNDNQSSSSLRLLEPTTQPTGQESPPTSSSTTTTVPPNDSGVSETSKVNADAMGPTDGGDSTMTAPTTAMDLVLPPSTGIEEEELKGGGVTPLPTAPSQEEQRGSDEVQPISSLPCPVPGVVMEGQPLPSPPVTTILDQELVKRKEEPTTTTTTDGGNEDPKSSEVTTTQKAHISRPLPSPPKYFILAPKVRDSGLASLLRHMASVMTNPSCWSKTKVKLWLLCGRCLEVVRCGPHEAGYSVMFTRSELVEYWPALKISLDMIKEKKTQKLSWGKALPNEPTAFLRRLDKLVEDLGGEYGAKVNDKQPQAQSYATNSYKALHRMLTRLDVGGTSYALSYVPVEEGGKEEWVCKRCQSKMKKS